MPSTKLQSEVSRFWEIDPTLKQYPVFLKNFITLKYKDMLKETLEEYTRSSEFVRIFPWKGCDIYNKYFESKRASNVFLYKALFTEEILPIKIQNFSEVFKSLQRAERISNQGSKTPGKVNIRIKKNIIATKKWINDLSQVWILFYKVVLWLFPFSLNFRRQKK